MSTQTSGDSSQFANRADLVFEGGGVKGIAHVGAVAALQEGGITTYPRVAGTSAGAIVGALAAAGMPAAEMRRIMEALEYHSVRDRRGLARVPLAGKPLSLAFNDGFYAGEYIRDYLGEALQKEGIETFGDLRIDDAERRDDMQPQQDYKLVVMVTDITNGMLVRLPWDYERLYGLNPDSQRVVDAVRASMAIPFYFEPVRLADAEGNEAILVDGGVLSNFAIDVFDRRDGQPPRWPTFGVKLLPKLPADRAQLFPLLGLIPKGPLHLLELLVSTMLVGRDQTQLNLPWVAARTILADTSVAGITEFGISAEKMNELYDNGYTATQEFLRTWDFDEYRRLYRH